MLVRKNFIIITFGFFLWILNGLVVPLVAFETEQLSCGVSKSSLSSKHPCSLDETLQFCQKSLEKQHFIKRSILNELSMALEQGQRTSDLLHLIQEIAEKGSYPWQRACWFEALVKHALEKQQYERLDPILNFYQEQARLFGSDLSLFKKILTKVPKDTQNKLIHFVKTDLEKGILKGMEKLDWSHFLVVYGDPALRVTMSNYLLEQLKHRKPLEPFYLKYLKSILQSVPDETIHHSVFQFLLEQADQSQNTNFIIACCSLLIPYAATEEKMTIILVGSMIQYEDKLATGSLFTQQDYEFLSRALRYMHAPFLRSGLCDLVNKIKKQGNFPSREQFLWQHLIAYNHSSSHF